MDTHATTRSWPGDKPTGQPSGSFPRACSEKSANSRVPGAIPAAWAIPPLCLVDGTPFPGCGRCLILWPGSFPPPAAVLALLVVLQRLFHSAQGRGRQAGGCAQPAVFGGCPRVQGCRCLPTAAAGAAGPVLTAGSHNNPRPAGRGGPGDRGPPVPLGSWRAVGPKSARPGAAAAPPEAGDPRVPAGAPRCSAAQPPRRRGGRGSRRAVPAVPNGRPRPDIKAAAAAPRSLRRPGPPEPPLLAASAAAMGRPPPPLRRALVFLSILLPPLLPPAGSAAGAGTRRAREPGPRGAGRWGGNPCLILRGCGGRPPHQGSLLISPRWAVGGSPAAEDDPVLLISRWCVLDACAYLSP